MVLPLSLLNAAQGQPMLVELKSGETINGHLVSCDTWMNITLKEVIQTSADGEHFVKMAETYIRGNIIKYLRVPEELLDVIKEDRQKNMDLRNRNQHRQGGQGHGQGRGGRGPRGGGRGERDQPNKRF